MKWWKVLLVLLALLALLLVCAGLFLVLRTLLATGAAGLTDLGDTVIPDEQLETPAPSPAPSMASDDELDHPPAIELVPGENYDHLLRDDPDEPTTEIPVAQQPEDLEPYAP